MRYHMLDMRYRSVNIGYRIHRISYRKCAYDMVYDIVCLYYDIVCQPTISYVDIRYRRVPRIQMAAAPGQGVGLGPGVRVGGWFARTGAAEAWAAKCIPH